MADWVRFEGRRVIFEQGVRKSLSIVATPLSTAQAMRDIRKEKVEYVTDAAQKAKIGQLADLSDAQEYHDVIDRGSRRFNPANPIELRALEPYYRGFDCLNYALVGMFDAHQKLDNADTLLAA